MSHTTLFAYFHNDAVRPAVSPAQARTHSTISTYRGADVNMNLVLGADDTKFITRRYAGDDTCHTFATIDVDLPERKLRLLTLTIREEDIDAATRLRDELTGVLKFLHRQRRKRSKGAAQ